VPEINCINAGFDARINYMLKVKDGLPRRFHRLAMTKWDIAQVVWSQEWRKRLHAWQNITQDVTFLFVIVVMFRVFKRSFSRKMRHFSSSLHRVYDEAIQRKIKRVDCRASLAMTEKGDRLPRYLWYLAMTEKHSFCHCEKGVKRLTKQSSKIFASLLF
jgi:hypothetical protein